MAIKKMWGGRFQEGSSKLVDEFGASISFDKHMAYEDLEGSLAHVKMLKHTHILSDDDADKIIDGLHILQNKLANGELTFSTELEDIHMNMESLLTQEIGDVAGKLHTARSRNDQVATDLHLYLKNRLEIVIDEIKNLQKVSIVD